MTQEFRRVIHHPTEVAVVFVVGDFAEHVRAGHGDLHRPPCEGRGDAELFGQAEVDIVDDAGLAGRCRVEDVWIAKRDGLRAGRALERWDLLPEMVQHGVGRRVAIVGAPVHLAARNDVYASQFLLQDRRFAGAELGVAEGAHGQLTHGDQAVERLVPIGHAVRSDYGGRVLRIERHPAPLRAVPEKTADQRSRLADATDSAPAELFGSNTARAGAQAEAPWLRWFMS